MRYSLTVDFEDREDVDAFLAFVRFHSSRMKCLEKDVFVKLAKEWKTLSALPETKPEVQVKEKKK